MSTIATFYSYKGGVGRSMTLANVAVLLARRGLRVLAVDWDLEAPGLDWYFDYYETSAVHGGVLPFFSEAVNYLESNKPVPNYLDHLRVVDIGDTQLQLLPSGRTSPAEYAVNLESFSWTHFFKVGGGSFLEDLRNQWLEEFDVVLIDSRTGLSDTGGICTIFLPDVLVAMFTPNHQSLYGVRDAIEFAQQGRQRIAYDRMPLTVLPILSRFVGRTEYRLSQEWLDRSSKEFDSALNAWLPDWVEARQVFERLKIPQVDYFSFGERLAVAEELYSDPSSMAYVLDRLADLLASDFDDFEAALGSIAKRPTDWIDPKVQTTPAGAQKDLPVGDWDYDLYVSYAHHTGGALTEWIQAFISSISEYLELEMDAPPRIFFERVSLNSGSSFPKQLDQAITRSKLMLALLTPAYFASKWNNLEWEAFAKREQNSLADSVFCIFPVVLRGHSVLPTYVEERRYLDFSKHVNLKDPEAALRHPDAARGIADLATDIARQLSMAPLRPNPPPKEI